jgi:hypothetical protein
VAFADATPLPGGRAASGGWLIVNSGGMEPLHWAGLASMLAAMAVSALASRQRARHRA